MAQGDCIRKNIIVLMIIFMVSSICIIEGRELIEMGSMPIIKGKLVYHSYTSYDAWDSKLYWFDFETKQLECINDYIQGPYHTMNGSFNLDGTQIVFMGVTNEEGEEEWNIFCYTLATRQLEQLTYDLRNEDPKFSPDGSKVIYKQGKWDEDLEMITYSICEMDLKTKVIRKLTKDIVEKSMPYYSRDGKSAYYVEGVGAQSKICNIQLDDSLKISEVFSESDTHAYYPVVYQDNLYFTKSYTLDNTNDMVVKMNLITGELEIPDFNNEDYNCSDPYPLADGLLVISSTGWDGQGGYDLYIVNEKTGRKWSLIKYSNQINTEIEQLGAACYIEGIDWS